MSLRFGVKTFFGADRPEGFLSQLEVGWILNMTYSISLRFILVLITCSLAISNSFAAEVGFRQITLSDLKIGVWYPTKTPETEGRIGPFDVSLAFDAPPISVGRFQPILMSHGNSGRMRNHHLTAKALAKAGFIAIAPLHAADSLVGTRDTYKAMKWRSNELRHALEAVVQIVEFRNIIVFPVFTPLDIL